MFLRWLETAASRSMPGTRKSPITLVTSKNPFLLVVVFAFAMCMLQSERERTKSAPRQFLLHCTISPISPPKAASSRDFVAVQQKSRGWGSGWFRGWLFAPACREAEPTLGLAQPGIERRHRLGHVGGIVGKPDAQDRKVNAEQQLRPRSAAPAAGRHAGELEHPAHRIEQSGYAAEGREGIGGHVAGDRPHRRLVGRECVKAPHDGIKETIAGPLALRLPGGDDGGIDAAMKGLQDRGLRAEKGVELQYADAGLGSDVGDAEALPAVARGKP